MASRLGTPGNCASMNEHAVDGSAQPVLIVDDDPMFAAMVADALCRAGFESRHVPTGGEAIELARRERPTAVILDVLLPGATGYEICRELRDEHGEQLPIVFVSGERTDAADKVAGLLVGGDDYLVKPFGPRRADRDASGGSWRRSVRRPSRRRAARCTP